MQGRVTARHEILNGRLKNWGILLQVFRHHINAWRCAPGRVPVLTQLTVKNGAPLFEVEFEDYFYDSITCSNFINHLFLY
jgi:hypothetical protein